MPINYDQYTQSGAYARFDQPGDTVIGIVKVAREGRDFNGNPCPELVLEQEDGSEITVTAGQVMLKAALAEKRPQEGDKIKITYSAIGDAKPGKAPAKLFEVAVKEGPHQLQNAVVADSEAPF